MKYNKLEELIKESRYIYHRDVILNVMTNKQHEAILFSDDDKFSLFKSKGRKDFTEETIQLENIKSFEEVKGIFKIYNYLITFQDDSELRISSVDFNQNKMLEEKFIKQIDMLENKKQKLSNSIIDEETGEVLAYYQAIHNNKKRCFIGNNDVAGWSFRIDELDACKKEQFQEKWEGTLEAVSVQPERDNEFDNEAIKILVNNTHIGYLPRHSKLKDVVNRLIDLGYQEKISGFVNYDYDREEKRHLVDVDLHVYEDAN